MRSTSLALLLSLIAGCGAKRTVSEAAMAPRVEPQAPAATAPGDAPAATADRPGDAAPRESVGHLDRPDRLAHFFRALADLDEGRSRDDVRVVQFGDSHTAADMGTGTLRHILQARFGDGGRGFVSIGKPWKSYSQEGVRGGMTADFEPTKFRFKSARTVGDGMFGLLGVGIGADAGGARAWTTIIPSSSRIELDYLRDPRGGSFDVFIDGAPAGRVATRAAEAASGFSGFDVPDAPHQIELRTRGDGDVRVFGMTLDRARHGVVVDALGINGAQVFTPLTWSEAHFAEQLRHRAPDLVILAYGTNEALDPKLEDAEYERAVVELLGRVARAAPSASCLLLGPPDLARPAKGRGWAPWPRLAEIIAVQRKVAAAAGCAYFDRRGAMGGPGAIIAWAAERDPRAQRDRVHLTRSGYAQVATAFADDTLRAYDGWRAELGMPPARPSRTWGVAAR